MLPQRLENENLHHRRADPGITPREEAAAQICSENRVEWGADIDSGSDAGHRLPLRIDRVVNPLRVLQEEIEPVLVEDVEGIRAANQRQLVESQTGGGDAVDPGVIEHSELVATEPIEIAAAEVSGVHMDLVKAEVQIA